MVRVVNRSDLYRYERKFIASPLTVHEIEALIKWHPAMFSEIYTERYVNNIYFDTCSMENYYANIDGVQHRTKCRIRWYGALFGMVEQPVLELKIKSGLLGRKEIFSLPSFSLDENFHMDMIEETFRNSDIPDTIIPYMWSLHPILLNRYRRKYYQSADQNYRITVDSDLEFYLIHDCNNHFLHRVVDNTNVVVELKYNFDADDLADKIATYFPFRISKSSKYVTGIQTCYGIV